MCMMLTRPTLRVSPPARSRTPARELWRVGGWFLLPVEFRADTNRDGTITGADDAGKDEFTNERGVVYVVNYDHDEERDGGKQEDALKWKATSDGKDEYGITKLKLRPNGEEWHIDPDKEDTADLTPLEISVPELPEDISVFLKVKDENPDDAKAFHLYIARLNEAGEITQYVPLWGGFDVSGSAPQDVTIGTEVDITKWVNENASDYDDTRESAGSGPYKLYLEGTIFRSMPIPGDDGYGRYDGTSEIFDGDIEIGLELREGGSAMAEADWVKLSHCAVEPDDPDKIVAFEGHTDYHTAQGFGKYAKGGRYGHVYTVTNTGDDGDDPTTLRYAVESPVPRTIIFALDGGDGTITLTEPLQAKAPRMTIAGQTAFRNGAEGMCLKGNGLIIQGDDMVVRYIRSRPGPEGGRKRRCDYDRRWQFKRNSRSLLNEFFDRYANRCDGGQ